MPRGGKREGAGRKPGPGRMPKPRQRPPATAVDKLPMVEVLTAQLVPQEVIDQVNARLKGSPIEVITALASMPLPANLTEQQERWERSFRLECHKIAAPYMHPRLASVAFQAAPPPSQSAGRYVGEANDAEETGALETARRVAFTLALGHQAAEITG